MKNHEILSAFTVNSACPPFPRTANNDKRQEEKEPERDTRTRQNNSAADRQSKQDKTTKTQPKSQQNAANKRFIKVLRTSRRAFESLGPCGLAAFCPWLLAPALALALFRLRLRLRVLPGRLCNKGRSAPNTAEYLQVFGTNVVKTRSCKSRNAVLSRPMF